MGLEKGTESMDGELVRPDRLPSPYKSILSAIYWCCVSMTSVGYGDYYPITLEGKIVAVLTLFGGVVLIALPVIIVGSELQAVKAGFLAKKVDDSAVANSPIWAYFQELNKIINEVCEEGGNIE